MVETPCEEDELEEESKPVLFVVCVESAASCVLETVLLPCCDCCCWELAVVIPVCEVAPPLVENM